MTEALCGEGVLPVVCEIIFGGDELTMDVDVAMLDDADCEWIFAEAPNGHGVVADGTPIGCCC